MRRIILAIAALTLLGASNPVLSLQREAVTVDQIAADVYVKQYRDYVRIRFDFVARPSSTYPVACLNAYKDVHYELKNATGHLIPIDQATLTNPPYDIVLNVGSHFDIDAAHDCKTMSRNHWSVFADLAALYPKLPPGTYQLTITLAPRGLSETKGLPPVQIKLQ